MAKVAVALRLSPGVIARVDAYAKARSTSRQVVLETFVLSGLEDTERGVPDLVKPEPKTPVSEPALSGYEREAQEFRAARWARQQKLNEAKERASR
jgi:hypothetical protein